jgi:CubicO group peptidase (beta-lactamase class C family)
MSPGKFGFWVVLLTYAVSVSTGAVVAAEDPDDDPILSELDEDFAAARRDLAAPALVFGVVADGELLHQGAFGVRNLNTGEPARPDTHFRIASMTKMMTALLVLDLHDQGKVALDAPAENYLEVLRTWVYPTTDSRKVTVRDLLNHTAGFVTDDPWADRQMARSQEELEVMLTGAEPFSTAPGSRFEYSNLGFVLLGQIIQKTSGQSFSTRLRERLLDPLGMKDTVLDFTRIPDDRRAQAYNWVDDSHIEEPVLGSGSFDPLGGIWTTAEDYAKFVAWFLSAWPPRNDPETGVIPRRVIRSVTDGVYLIETRHRSGLDGADDCQVASGYSMGLGIHRHCDAGLVLTHGGGFPGFGSYVAMMPDSDLGVFAFANRTYADVYGPVWDAAIKLSKSKLGAEPAEIPPDPRLQVAYEGVVAVYNASSISSGGIEFEDNFFLDRSADRWNRQIAEIHAIAGKCETAEPLETDGSLSASFGWNCENARIKGVVTLSPVKPDEIQYLHLRLVRRDEDGRDLNTDFDFH